MKLGDLIKFLREMEEDNEADARRVCLEETRDFLKGKALGYRIAAQLLEKSIKECGLSVAGSSKEGEIK